MIVKLSLKLLIKYPQRIWNSFFLKGQIIRFIYFKIKNHKHVRNPKINQYKTKFPQNVLNEFSEQYGTLLLKYKKYNNDKS